ncbi:MAG: SIMPL domain-containing protein [Pseudomonadota bacterium]
MIGCWRPLLTFLLMGSIGVSLSLHAEPVVEPSVSVRGEAVLQVSPDQVTVSIGVSSEAEQAKEALATNSQSMNSVIAAIEKLGLDQADYRTRQLNIQALWSSRPRNAENGWRPQIVAYRVSNTLEVKTTKLGLSGEIIQQATQAGANTVHSLRFDLSDPRHYRRQAISQAVANAKADAEAVARAAGVSIAGVKRIHLDQQPSIGQVRAETAELHSAPANIAAPLPPVSPGDVTVRASVLMEFWLGER